MKRILLLTLLFTLCLNLCKAQRFGYDSKTEIGNGLYKVKSGSFYGVIDSNDNVVVSIEYQDIVFRSGYALLTKDDILWGVIDSTGVVKSHSGMYKVHPRYRYVYEGYILVSFVKNWMKLDKLGYMKWGYIDVNGRPLKIRQKIKGAISIGKNLPTLFDDVIPFVDGCASVFLKKYGWKHIDTKGFERYNFSDQKVKASFRSSIYKGECIIITDDGIKQYQENDNYLAVVKRILSSSATFVKMDKDAMSNKIIYKEGVLTLDSLMRVTKYEVGNDSIVFIEKPKKVIVKKVEVPVDTLSLKEDFDVKLVYKNLQANEKGKAYTEVKLINTSNDKFENLWVTLECTGNTKEWSGPLDGNSEIKIPFNIPARFSSPSIKRSIFIEVSYKGARIEFECPVTIKRYTPIRSR